MALHLGKHWHVVSDDIRCPRRLRRVHRLVADECLAVQRSVFLFHGSRSERNHLLERLQERIEAEDDVRIYPAPHPARLWMSARVDGMTSEGNGEPMLVSGDHSLSGLLRRAGRHLGLAG